MIVLYLLFLFFLGLYSYSQIDLNLTLLQTPWFLSFQNTMIQLGYYQRPLSTSIFLVLISGLFIFYLRLLKNPPQKLYLLIGGIVAISLLAYPAFSHDFFNYLFDARIVTLYHQNPYFFKALDFPTDTWIRFMHWTHRTYPYGPFWLILTLPVSFLGLGKFILTALNFKLLFAAFYLGSTLLIKKLSGNRSALFFATNPVVVIESLVSPHLDSSMAFFFLLGLYFLVSKKRLFALLAVLASGGVKFLTWVTLPLFFGLPIKRVFQFSLALLLVALIPVIWQREAYPWYFLPPLAVTALLIDDKKIFLLSVAVSLGLMLHYLPFLYFGQEVLFWENLLVVVPILLCALGLIFFRRR
ncbi:hypothetical protein HY440_01255 [Candidatus Microgenomates bacterium]|nr:hypothetical protein [Candidatus Microgenomates bacterium]